MNDITKETVNTDKVFDLFVTMINTTSHYKHYSNSDTIVNQMNNWFDEFNEELKKCIDFNALTECEMRKLGFKKYEDMMLIPLYLLPVLPIGFEVKSILGDKIVYDGTNLDDDSRAGMLAYGICPTK